ncbi:hypothetical protein Y032_0123g1129 [Ancylostoma ceylanicum]|uniref:Uncharacterized protein n=1 Tax=Ancylostoma ceylanicum TaxID=53326 RepID=A0A016T9J7_9BILA|nr:hypothetical protein Y032_0123g1129 [Ancylostoma ceylanicum]
MLLLISLCFRRFHAGILAGSPNVRVKNSIVRAHDNSWLLPCITTSPPYPVQKPENGIIRVIDMDALATDWPK